MKEKIYMLFILFLVVMNVFLWIQDMREFDDSKGKYKMVMQEDESKEFISISFIKVDENIK